MDQTVVSVGPYMFQTEAALAINCSASSRGMASPPQRILRFPFPIQPDSSSNFQVEGVACMTVIW